MAIPHRILGRTGLSVSALSLGTVALGVVYGIQDGSAAPNRSESIALLQAASEAGINLFDTAPNYGEAESIVGTALGKHHTAIIATKVSLPPRELRQSTTDLQKAIHKSVDTSRKALQRDVIDLLQVHNLNTGDAADPRIGEALESLRQQGKVRFLGASVYTEDEAMIAMHAGWVDMLQVPYSLLDQRMASRVFPAAEALGIGIMTRSAYLKGALTNRARHLPAQLGDLQAAVYKLADAFALPLESLPRTALEFCLGEQRVGSVLIGASTMSELEYALDGVNYGRIDDVHTRGLPYALNDPALVDPRRWPLP